MSMKPRPTDSDLEYERGMKAVYSLLKRPFKIHKIHHRRKEDGNEEGAKTEIDDELEDTHRGFMKVIRALSSETTAKVSRSQSKLSGAKGMLIGLFKRRGVLLATS